MAGRHGSGPQGKGAGMGSGDGMWKSVVQAGWLPNPELSFPRQKCREERRWEGGRQLEAA